jgi:hypothetical protein
MSDEELMAFDIYRGACTASRLMCLNLVNHIEHRHGLRPFATASGYLQWNPNFALIQTLGVRTPILTINLSGRQERYHGLGIDDLVRKPWKGLTRMRISDPARIHQLLAAVDRSYEMKSDQRG